ncbi:ATP-binding protein [Streptomyces adelaidensis]|uniref:ATP-binding protein n=1 Tax=Streptomyces adelaidensis TaxID=2796465 RepID=UPI0019061042|nr:ATP-binding protein [Streptomyces adelaidensis]
MPATGDPTATTPDEPWTYTLSIPNNPRAVTIARRTLRLILTLHDLHHLTDAAELVATELVTNAVRHTKGPAAMRLHWRAPALRVSVWDTDPRPPAPAPPAHATPNPALESGRGLTLIEECSDSWGWYPLGVAAQPPHANGKFVWCELARAA